MTLAKLQKESNKKTINCGQKNKISSQTNILKQKLKPDRSKYPWFNYCLKLQTQMLAVGVNKQIYELILTSPLGCSVKLLKSRDGDEEMIQK